MDIQKLKNILNRSCFTVPARRRRRLGRPATTPEIANAPEEMKFISVLRSFQKCVERERGVQVLERGNNGEMN